MEFFSFLPTEMEGSSLWYLVTGVILIVTYFLVDRDDRIVYFMGLVFTGLIGLCYMIHPQLYHAFLVVCVLWWVLDYVYRGMKE